MKRLTGKYFQPGVSHHYRNLNGIRAAARKGFFGWMDASSRTSSAFKRRRRKNTSSRPRRSTSRTSTLAFVDAQKKGYSGVAIYAKRKPERVVRGLGIDE